MGGFVYTPAMTGATTMETKGPSNVLTRIRKIHLPILRMFRMNKRGRLMKNQIVLVMQQDLHLMKMMKLER
jgi:hypothetical protein